MVINTFIKVEGSKVNMQKLVAFLYTNDKYTRKKSRKQSLTEQS